MPFFIAIVILAIFIAYLHTPRGKGRVGEMCVKLVIGRTKPGEKYIINNLILKPEEGKTSQIDHVVINDRGVFVIETKNYSGRIYGKENQLEWTQVLSYGRVKHKLYNPIKQNKSHIYNISKILSMNVPITSAVVFVQGNTQCIDASGIYTLKGLKQLLACPSVCLTTQQMEKIYNELIAANDTSVSMREHIQNIKTSQKNISNNMCPRCGKSLVLREGKNGEFYGCMGYPACKFTKKNNKYGR